MNQQALSRRQFLQLGAMTVAGTALAACVAAPASSGGSNAPAATQNLSFWMWNTFAPPAAELMQEKLTEWGKANNITVEISRDADSNMQTKIMPAIEAGTLPDVMFVDAANALRMTDSQALAPLTDMFPTIGDAHGGWQNRLKEYVTRDGVVTFLPYSIDTPMVQFRQDIMEEAGITVPEGQWTWEQTRDLCVQAAEFTESKGDKKIGWGFGIVKQTHDGWCDDLFRNYGADIWDESGTKIILKDQKSKEAIDALNFAKSAYERVLVHYNAADHDYDYLDNGVNRSGIYYYRIKQVDKDGVYNYSKVVSIKISVDRNLGVVIYPNPVNELLKVEFWISDDAEVEVTVFDQAGKNVMSNPFGGFHKSGNYIEDINTSILAPGQYSLQIKTSNGIVNKRFSVSR